MVIIHIIKDSVVPLNKNYTMTLILLLISDTFFLVMIVMVCVSVTCTVFVIHVAGNTYQIPRVIQKLFSHRQLLRILCVHHHRRQENIVFSSTVCSKCGSTTEGDFLANHTNEESKTDKGLMRNNSTDHEDNSKQEDVVISDWKGVALVVDRCLLVIFLSFAWVTSLSFLVKLYIDTHAYRDLMADHAHVHNATELIQ